MTSKKLIKQLTNNCNPIFLGLTVLIIIWSFYQYSSSKGVDYMAGSMAKLPNMRVSNSSGGGGVRAANPLGENEVFSSAKGISTSQGASANSAANLVATKPSDLLPKDKHNEWAKMNPTGNGDLKNVNLLKAGYHIGINTVGNSLRNANLQIRSEPANPQMNTGPWNASTIEPDLHRQPLDIGGQ
jgi:hypothetical protein